MSREGNVMDKDDSRNSPKIWTVYSKLQLADYKFDQSTPPKSTVTTNSDSPYIGTNKQKDRGEVSIRRRT